MEYDHPQVIDSYPADRGVPYCLDCDRTAYIGESKSESEIIGINDLPHWKVKCPGCEKSTSIIRNSGVSPNLKLDDESGPFTLVESPYDI